MVSLWEDSQPFMRNKMTMMCCSWRGKGVAINVEYYQGKSFQESGKLHGTGLRLESVHQEPPCKDVYTKDATAVTFLILRHC